jgi:hypothetical protein
MAYCKNPSFEIVEKWEANKKKLDFVHKMAESLRNILSKPAQQQYYKQ